MEIRRNGSQPSNKGPAEWFTGTVRMDPIAQTPDPALLQALSVTFEPGARSAWHSHPMGQVLVVVAGCGRVQSQGGTVQEIQPGDVIWTPPGETHWHGACPTTSLTHLALQERKDGKFVEWKEKVSDQEYGAGR